jgi:hypothetical protein
MKYYNIDDAELLMSFYSHVEPIEGHFELVHTDKHPEKVGILCIDKSSDPPLVTEIDDVVKGLELTPITAVLYEVNHLREIS